MSTALAPDKRLTKILEEFQNNVQEISARLYELTDSDYVQEINHSIRKLGEKAEKISQQRFAAYQKYVAEKCDEAISDYDEKTRVGENYAKQLLDDYHFAEVDESLLSPEAASVFHETKSILLNKLGMKEKTAFQKQCVIGKKKKLEDF